MKCYLAPVALLLACTVASAAHDASIPLLSMKGANWSAEEGTYIRALHKKGSIRIATKLGATIYMPQQDGSITGFHYQVLNEFAKLAKVRIDIKLVTWSEYFYKKGEDVERVKTDPDYTYVPTLIDNVDLYLDGITVLPWREKMFDIVKIVPSRQMIVARKDNKPRQVADLNDKVCAMVKNTSMEFNLEKLKRTEHIHFTYINAEDFDALDRMVSTGQADFTVYDSDRAFVALANYKNLDIAWPISELEIMGWAVNKKNTVLKHVLEKYIRYAQETAILDTYWKQSYGVTFIEYLNVLKLTR